MPLLPGRLICPNILQSPLGELGFAMVVDVEVTAQLPNKLMLFTKKAGEVKSLLGALGTVLRTQKKLSLIASVSTYNSIEMW